MWREYLVGTDLSYGWLRNGLGTCKRPPNQPFRNKEMLMVDQEIHESVFYIVYENNNISM